MNLFCRAKSILAPATTIRRLPFRTLTLVTIAGLLVGYGSVASATTSPAIPIIQEHEEEDHNIEVVVIQDGDSEDHQGMLKKLKSELKGQIHEIISDAGDNIEVVVVGEGDSDHQGLLKKLKSELKVQIHEIISDAGDNVEVVVVGEGDSDHQGLLKKLKSEHKFKLHKLHSNADGKHNVFVLKDGDEEGDVKMDIHGHLAELLHGQESGKMNHQALARKLRQLADRLEAKHNGPHSTHKTNGKIEIHPSGGHKFHIETRGKKENANHQEFEFTTDTGKHIVIGKPGQTGTMVVELKPAGGGKLHSHDGDQKKIILRSKKHNAGHNVLVERIHLDGDHSPSDLSKKIMDRIKKQIPEHKIEIEEIHKDGDHNTHAHESHAFEGKRSQDGLDASIRDLKNELEELRRELKELQSDRPDRTNA